MNDSNQENKIDTSQQVYERFVKAINSSERTTHLSTLAYQQVMLLMEAVLIGWEEISHRRPDWFLAEFEQEENFEQCFYLPYLDMASKVLDEAYGGTNWANPFRMYLFKLPGWPLTLDSEVNLEMHHKIMAWISTHLDEQPSLKDSLNQWFKAQAKFANDNSLTRQVPSATVDDKTMPRL